MKRPLLQTILLLAIPAWCWAQELPWKVMPGERIVLIGNGLGERMLYFPHFETELHHRCPNANLIVRNLSRAGDTAGFRPHPSRVSQWAFPGAEAFHPDLQTHLGVGHFETPDQWLTRLEADTIIAFFGYNESFNGTEGLANFRGELESFVAHTLSQRYNGNSAPRLVLASPLAFEDLSARQDLPNGEEENRRLAAYSEAMREVALAAGVGFVDLFRVSADRYRLAAQPLTINGFAPTEEGYRWLGAILAGALYQPAEAPSVADRQALYQAVQDKDWYWRNDYGMLNGVHVHGRRYQPFGDVNYPEEIEKIRQMTTLRDAAIHRMAKAEAIAIEVDDSRTRALTEIETNFDRPIEFLEVDRALERFTLPDGYRIGLFASESEFPDLRNPVQMSFDGRGRLWVAVAPSYPHYRPGDERPNDKLLIFEDTDQDGRADRQIVFAEGLHLPIGFELAAEGVYLAQQPNLALLVDEDGDDQADRTEILLHGFDTHDTHHSISAFCADASGAIYMNEGRFLHSQVETPYGPRRCADGGVWRFDPRSWRLEREVQTDVSNPWGIAFDEWGQMFVSDASGGANWWALPLSVKLPHGAEIAKVDEFTTHRVRPTSGVEFVYSRHFPDETQGDFLINNTIGFLGAKQHTIEDSGAGYTGRLRQDLISSTDPNFRPCDLEFAPDGSLYLIDWHNPLIGHMQHSARDPNRDHDHGRIYRVTYPSRPLVKPPEIAGASIDALLDVLAEPEQRARYRARRELRGRPAAEVLEAARSWADRLDRSDPNYDRNLVEALWVTWAQGQTDPALLERCLASPRHESRAAAAHALRYSAGTVRNAERLLLQAASDPHPRVRLEAVAAASWWDDRAGARVALKAMEQPVTKWMGYAFEAAMAGLAEELEELVRKGELDTKQLKLAQRYLSGEVDLASASRAAQTERHETTNMSAEVQVWYDRGKEIYRRDAHCATCHGEDGKGTVAGVYPPLLGSEWLQANDELLVQIVLKGLWGDIEVAGKPYTAANGVPPMTGFEHMLNDEEIAAVLTYARVAFDTRKSLSRRITPETVRQVRHAVRDKAGYYTPEELRTLHGEIP